MTEEKVLAVIRRELRFLRWYAFIATAAIALLLFSAFEQNVDKHQFDEIDVQRINIVEKDGSPRIILASRSMAPDLIIKGKAEQRGTGKNSPGIIFYNDEGSECGALSTASSSGENGSYTSSSRLVFDQFQSDETIALQYIDENGKRYAGLTVMDRPETQITPEITTKVRAMWNLPQGAAKNKALNELDSLGVFESERVFIGKTQRKSATVSLSDRKGNLRVHLWVDSLGTPRLDFLDKLGNITCSLPDSLHAASLR